MKFVILVVIVAVVVAVVAKFRGEAKREREEVLARLAGGAEAADTISPTEALFREAGVPVPEAMRAGLVGAPPPPTANPLQSALDVLNKVRPTPLAPTETPPIAPTAPAVDVPAAPGDGPAHRTDLSDLFVGIEMPCELVPLSMVGAPGVNCAVATFTADAGRRPELAAALGTELHRIGCEVTWIDHATAMARRGADSAIVRIYDRPSDLTGPDGAPAHPEVGDDRVLVSLTAT